MHSIITSSLKTLHPLAFVEFHDQLGIQVIDSGEELQQTSQTGLENLSRWIQITQQSTKDCQVMQMLICTYFVTT